MKAILSIPATILVLVASATALILTAPIAFVLVWLRWFRQWE